MTLWLTLVARPWHDLLITTRTKLGFDRCLADLCVARLFDSNTKKITIILVHEDDTFVAGSGEDC